MQGKEKDFGNNNQSEHEEVLAKDIFDDFSLEDNKDFKINVKQQSVDKDLKKPESTSEFRIDPDSIDLS